MRVGVLGADLGVAKVREVAADVRCVALVPLVYEREEQVDELLASAARRIDVALFCGPVPYLLARDAIPPGLPATFIPYDGSGLVKALFDFYRLPAEGPDAFSVDSVPREVVLRGIAEVEMDVRDVVAISDGAVLPRERLVERHAELWRERRTRAAVTYLRSVQRELEAAGVPTIYVQPLASSVRVALDRAVLLTEHRSSEAAQLVIVLARVPRPHADGSVQPLKFDLGAQSLLLDVAEETDAALLPLGDGLYALYTTRAGLDRIGDWALGELPFLERLADVLGADPKLGIGFGGTSKEAQSNAMRALTLAQDVAGPRAFAVLRDGRLLGPLGGGTAEVRETRVHDASLLEEARRVGVAARSLSQIYAYLATFRVFDTEKLARLLGVSERSARRVVSRLVEAGIVESAGEESVHRRGRPRPLYRLAPPRVEPEQLSQEGASS